MPVVQVAERAGTDISEDVVRTLPNAVALLDGATSVRPRTRTGGWYAEQLGDALVPRLSTNADLADLLADAIAEVTDRYGLTPGDAPSSTVSLLRWDDDSVEALVLADSPIVVFTDAGEHRVTDDRLANLRVAGQGGYRERLRSGGGFGDEHWSALRAAVDKTGSWRNVDGGFWVAEAVPEAAHRAARARWPREGIRAAVVASDGVSCGVDDYGIFSDWTDLLTLSDVAGPERVLDEVRAAEDSDPEGVRWPRPKRHDDQALVVLRF
jgi:hypothetical protein